MSARPNSILSRRPSPVAPQAEVDVTPVLNMFIILIPFLVSMAVFTHLATHAFSLPAEDGAGQARTADAVPLTVVLGVEAVAVVRGEVELLRLPVLAQTCDGEALQELLSSERARRPELDRVVVAVADGVRCAAVVRCLDRCRDAGYGDVGLAAGTGPLPAIAEVSP